MAAHRRNPYMVDYGYDNADVQVFKKLKRDAPLFQHWAQRAAKSLSGSYECYCLRNGVLLSGTTVDTPPTSGQIIINFVDVHKKDIPFKLYSK